MFAQARWVRLSTSLCMLGFAGMSATFPIYSPTLKVVGKFGQAQINALAVAKDLGESFGILPGLLCDLMPTWYLFLVGTLHFSLGFGAIWGITRGVIVQPGFLQMSFLLLVAYQGTAWVNTGALVTSLRSFPRSRGTVAGMLKGMVGLSGAIYTQLYSFTLAPDQIDFPCLLALIPVGILSLTSVLWSLPTAANEAGDDGPDLKLIMGSCMSLGLYLFVVNLAEVGPSTGGQVRLFCLLTLVLFFLGIVWIPVYRASHFPAQRPPEPPRGDCEEAKGVCSAPRQQETIGVGSVLGEQLRGSDSTDSLLSVFSDTSSGVSGHHEGGHDAAAAQDRDKDSSRIALEVAQQVLADATPSTLDGQMGARHQASNVFLETDALLAHNANPSCKNAAATKRRSSKVLLAVGEGAVLQRKTRGPRRGENFSMLQVIRKADFWLIVLSTLCCCGTGVTTINNMAQIGSAQGYKNVRFFVSLVSIGNFMGRICGGYASEHFVRSYVLPRSIILLLAQLLMAVSHLCFAFIFPYSIHIGSFLNGLCYGVHWSVMPATLSELFGLLHFGIIFNVTAAAMPLGSFLFSSVLAGTLYDREAARGSPGFLTPASMQQPDILRRTDAAPPSTWQLPECVGAHCFQLTFLCMSAMCLVGGLTASLLTFRTWGVYKRLYGATAL